MNLSRMGEAICLVLDVGATAAQKPEGGISFLDAALGKYYRCYRL